MLIDFHAHAFPDDIAFAGDGIGLKEKISHLNAEKLLDSAR